MKKSLEFCFLIIYDVGGQIRLGKRDCFLFISFIFTSFGVSLWHSISNRMTLPLNTNTTENEWLTFCFIQERKLCEEGNKHVAQH